MKVSNKTIELQTKEELEFIDITDRVTAFVEESQIKEGLVNVQTFHTTGAIVVNENEPLLIEDFKSHLENFASRNTNYKHNDFSVRTVNMCPDECANGHAHCRAIHLPITATLNLINGKVRLGQWQRIFFVELDKSRKRKFQIQILGE
ncbi:MAG: secondary thiamine-phosphate synthase enzyme YjbQ [bacterium]|nr:secondary thiamine-phosphate synthase enzyme YjbQ [bacterium]